MDHQKEHLQNEEIGITEVKEDLPRTDHMAYLPDMEKLPDSDIPPHCIPFRVFPTRRQVRCKTLSMI